MTIRRKYNSVSHKNTVKDPIKAAAEFGIDISALRDNLKLSPGERIRRLQIALNTVEKLRKAKRRGR